MGDMLFIFKNVGYCYDNGVWALKDCSFTIYQGSYTAIIGDNGAGKTTLLLHLIGIFKPHTGEILFLEKPIDYSRNGLRELRSKVGFVFQNPDSQLLSASVMEDVSFGPMNLGLDRKTVKERVEEALKLVGMTEFAQRPVHSLSFGQKKRVCIAGVLAMKPDVIVLDEPMAGLDNKMQEELSSILHDLHLEGKTIIIATHNVDFAYEWADSIICLKNGRILFEWHEEEKYLLDSWVNYRVRIPKIVELFNALIDSKYTDINTPPHHYKEFLMMIKKLKDYKEV